MNRGALVLIVALALHGADQKEKRKIRDARQNAALAAASAEIPQPNIAWVYPAGGRRGSTVDVTASGTNLAGATVQVSGSGVTGRVLSAARDGKETRLSLRIAPDAATGERELRLVTGGGVSNRFRFFIGDLPEVNESEPNSSRAAPQVIATTPAVINGQVAENDRDYFRFSATAGEKIVVDVHARRIIPFIADGVPGWFDPCLTLYDASGREVQYADDFRIQSDPVMVATIPADGEYTLELRDIIYRGRGDFVYRATVGAVPFVSHGFPLGGKRGSSVDVQLHGVNLKQDRVRLDIPAEAPWRFESAGLRLGASDYNEVVETESPGPQRITPPVVVNGRIGKPGDVDLYALRVERGTKLVLDVQARRLNSPMDPVLTILKADGTVLAESDDWVDPEDSPATHHADARLLQTFPTSGDYVIRVRDLQNNGGDEYAYRLIVAPPKPDFSLRISPDNPRLGRGDTAAITVDAIRKDEFGAEIALLVRNLPPGFHASEASIQSGQTQARFTITAPADAELQVVHPVVVGTSGALTRTAATAEPMMQAFASTHYMPTQGIDMAVLPASSFSMAADTPGVLEVARGSETPIRVKIVRQPDGKGPVTVTGARIGQIIATKPVQIPPDADEAIVTLVVGAEAPLGLSQNLILSGVMRKGRETITRVAPAIPIRVVAAPKSVDQ